MRASQIFLPQFIKGNGTAYFAYLNRAIEYFEEKSGDIGQG
jgi:hypothetical protein